MLCIILAKFDKVSTETIFPFLMFTSLYNNESFYDIRIKHYVLSYSVFHLKFIF